ncbi:MFS transporter [Streptomyces sp. NBC_01187]|uniref:MFS transporter n=1 Tax=unclassified Streptomyces TaxID=2593676 RepID=UPI003866FEFA
MPTGSVVSAGKTEPANPAPRTSWLSVIAVMMGIFSIVTTEILPIGLLTSIGSSFTVSDGMAGLMMTMPGILAAVSAPLVTVATARIDRRRMLCTFILLLAMANFLAAAASNYWLVLVSRLLVGIVIGGFWSIGAGLASRLVPAESVGRATAIIFSSVPLGSVLGVPLGTFVGDVAGWRMAFVVMGVLTVAVFAALLLVLPPLPCEKATRLAVLGGTLRSVNTRFALVATFLLVIAHFGAYTYITPFLEQITQVSSSLITVFLLVYGAAGIVGNFIGGATATPYPRATFAAAATMIATATLLLPVLGQWPAGAVALLVLWGAAYGAVPVCSQTWFTKAAPHTPEASTVIFTASFQATLSIGALAGGLIVDRSSPSTVMTLGGTTAALMTLVVWLHHTKRITWPGTD